MQSQRLQSHEKVGRGCWKPGHIWTQNPAGPRYQVETGMRPIQSIEDRSVNEPRVWEVTLVATRWRYVQPAGVGFK